MAALNVCVLPAVRAPTDQAAARPPRWGPSRAVRRWAVVLGVLLVAAGVAFGVRTWASDAEARYEDASSRYAAAREGYRDAIGSAVAARRVAAATLDVAARYTGLSLEPVVVPTATAGLDEAASELGALTFDEITDGAPVSTPRAESGWPPDLDRTTAELDAAARDLTDRAGALGAFEEQVGDAIDRVEDAGEALIVAVSESSEEFEASNPSARNADRLAFRDAADGVTARVGHWDAASADHLVSYAAAAAQLIASNAAELQERAGSFAAQRADVEAFARSIAGGVLLEFDWAPVVNGFGQGDSYGGWATVNAGGDPNSSISLSDSIARDWPSAIAQAVVVHEVGHAMSGKCTWIFTPGTREASEAWATAWAIGMGYDGLGNGESLYGRPSADLVDLSRGCR